jgi:Flp pilus assembly protein TadB
MSQRRDDDRLARARNARQVLSGADVRPPTSQSSVYASTSGLFSSSQRTYLISAGVLLVFGTLLWLIFGFSVASIIFFILSLTLIAGWLVF